MHKPPSKSPGQEPGAHASTKGRWRWLSHLKQRANSPCPSSACLCYFGGSGLAGAHPFGEGWSLLSLLLPMLTSSRDILIDTPRNVVSPALWASLRPVSWTHEVHRHNQTSIGWTAEERGQEWLLWGWCIKGKAVPPELALAGQGWVGSPRRQWTSAEKDMGCEGSHPPPHKLLFHFGGQRGSLIVLTTLAPMPHWPLSSKKARVLSCLLISL